MLSNKRHLFLSQSPELTADHSITHSSLLGDARLPHSKKEGNSKNIMEQNSEKITGRILLFPLEMQKARNTKKTIPPEIIATRRMGILLADSLNIVAQQ